MLSNWLWESENTSSNLLNFRSWKMALLSYFKKMKSTTQACKKCRGPSTFWSDCMLCVLHARGHFYSASVGVISVTFMCHFLFSSTWSRFQVHAHDIRSAWLMQDNRLFPLDMTWLENSSWCLDLKGSVNNGMFQKFEVVKRPSSTTGSGNKCYK